MKKISETRNQNSVWFYSIYLDFRLKYSSKLKEKIYLTWLLFSLIFQNEKSITYKWNWELKSKNLVT